MQYFCDADELTWFRLVSAAEAAAESQAMDHAVEKYFRRAWDEAADAYVPPASRAFIEQSIGREAHILKAMPLFLTLRDKEGVAHVTAMLPVEGDNLDLLSPIIVGPGNADPYADYGEAIEALARHVGYELDRAECYPYRGR